MLYSIETDGSRSGSMADAIARQAEVDYRRDLIQQGEAQYGLTMFFHPWSEEYLIYRGDDRLIVGNADLVWGWWHDMIAEHGRLEAAAYVEANPVCTTCGQGPEERFTDPICEMCKSRVEII